MATLTAKKSVFDMGSEEFDNLVGPVGLKAKQTALNNGAWFPYKNDLCVEPDMFIHEFKDGRKELVKLGKQAGDYTVLRVL